MINLFIFDWIQFANILLKTFASLFMKNVGLQFFSFFAMLFSVFGVRVMLTSNELGTVSSISWNILYRISIISFLNVCQNVIVKQPGHIFLYWQVFKYKFIFFNRCGTIQVIYFLGESFGNVFLSKKFVHFIRVIKFIGIKFKILPYF